MHEMLDEKYARRECCKESKCEHLEHCIIHDRWCSAFDFYDIAMKVQHEKTKQSMIDAGS